MLRIGVVGSYSNSIFSFLRNLYTILLNIHWKDWCWSWNSKTLAAWYVEPTHWERPSCWERLKTKGEGGIEDLMVIQHPWLQIPGDSEGQGNLVRCSPGDHKELDWTTEFSTVTGPIYIPTNSAGRFPILTASPAFFIYSFFFLKWWSFWSVWGGTSLRFDLHFSNKQSCWASFHVPVAHLYALWLILN